MKTKYKVIVRDKSISKEDFILASDFDDKEDAKKEIKSLKKSWSSNGMKNAKFRVGRTFKDE